jgi:hypothetical protein
MTLALTFAFCRNSGWALNNALSNRIASDRPVVVMEPLN